VAVAEQPRAQEALYPRAQLDLVDGRGAADELGLGCDRLGFGGLDEDSGRRRAPLRQRKSWEGRVQPRAPDEGPQCKTPLTHYLRPRLVAPPNTALFRQNGHGI